MTVLRRLPARGYLHLAAGLALVGVQLHHTLTDRSAWPFCSYNMFNRPTPRRMRHMRIVLLDEHGYRTEPQRVWGMLPMEHFRVASTFMEIYLDPETPDAVRERYSGLLVNRLNERPWKAFDQVKAPPRNLIGARWTGFDLYRVLIDLDDYDADRDRPHHDTELLYRFRS